MSQAKAKATPVDPKQISICDDRLPDFRARTEGKYDAIFAKMKMGQCIKCHTQDLGKVSSALRKYILKHKVKGTIRSMTNYGDGMGRVWLVALPVKALKAA